MGAAAGGARTLPPPVLAHVVRFRDEDVSPKFCICFAIILKRISYWQWCMSDLWDECLNSDIYFMVSNF